MSGVRLKVHQADDNIFEDVDLNHLLDVLDVRVVDPDGEELLCYCPFHENDGKAHNPSFVINAKTHLWVCRSMCGGGNLITLVQRCLGLGSGSEAYRWLVEFMDGHVSSSRVREASRVSPLDRIRKKLERYRNKPVVDQSTLVLAVQSLDSRVSRRIFKIRDVFRRKIIGTKVDWEIFSTVRFGTPVDMPTHFWDYVEFESMWQQDLYHWWRDQVDILYQKLYFYSIDGAAFNEELRKLPKEAGRRISFYAHKYIDLFL